MSIAVVTNGLKSSAGAATVTTNAADTTGANLLVVGFEYLVAAIPPGSITPTLTDNKGNSYRTLTIKTNAGGVSTVLAFVNNAVVGSGHTFTLTNLYPFFGSIKYLALSGASIHLPFDKQNGAIDAASAISGGLQTGSVSPSVDNEIIITALVATDTAGGETFAIDSGFTISDQIDYSAGNNYGSALAYKIQTTKAAVNPKWTISPAPGWDVAAAVIASFSTVTIPLPAPVLPLPEDSGTLAIYYAEQNAVKFYLANMTVEKMVYDVFTQLKLGAGEVVGTTLLQTIASLKAKLGEDCLIGTYISPYILDDIADTQDGYQTQDPKARIPGPGLAGTVFDESECLSYASGPSMGELIRPYNVDFMQPAVRAKMLSAIDDELLDRQDKYAMQIIETDNWIFDDISSPDFPYPYGLSDVLDWFDDVHDLIASRGYLHAPNFGFWTNGLSCSDASILRVANKADMVFYENGAQYTYLNNPTNVTEWLRRTQLVIGAGCRPLLSGVTVDALPHDPGNFPDGYVRETEFLSGLAMLLGTTHPYVGYAFFLPRDEFDFLLWPGIYGSPTAPIIQNGMTLRRQFNSYTLNVDMSFRNVSWSQQTVPASTSFSGSAGVRTTSACLGS